MAHPSSIASSFKKSYNKFMKKRAFIIHRWGGSPADDWLPWLKTELEKKDYLVIAPSMPDTDYPDIEKWVGCLNFELKNPDDQTLLIGHSIGCQAIMRYLEILPKPYKVGHLLFVAGWFNLKPETLQAEGPESVAPAEPWLETPIETEKVKHTYASLTVLLSDNDPYVPLADARLFETKLNAKVIV